MLRPCADDMDALHARRLNSLSNVAIGGTTAIAGGTNIINSPNSGNFQEGPTQNNNMDVFGGSGNNVFEPCQTNG